jgi:hypothetical protein
MQILKINFILLLLFTSLSGKYIQPSYTFIQTVNKEALRVGETFTLSLVLRSKALEDSEILEATFKDFVIKNKEEDSYRDTNKNWVESLTYTLQTKHAGTFTLKSQRAKIEYLDARYKGFNDRYKYLHKKTLKSNSAQITVISLPHDVEISGLYELSATVKKNTADKYHPIIYTIKLKGDGNLETLDKLKLHIENAKVYAKKSIKSNNILTKRFEILSNQNFIIPALSLKYFNLVMSEVRTLKTDSIAIEVLSSPMKPIKIATTHFNYIYLILASVIILLFFTLRFFNLLTPNAKIQKYRALKKSKTSKELLHKVAIYLGKSDEFDTLIYELEKVSKKKFVQTKKKILHIFYTSLIK